MGNEQQASWGREFVRMGRNAKGRIETSIKALAQFVEVLLKAPPGILAGWIGDGDLDHGCDQKPLDLCHGRPRFNAPAVARWRRQATGKGIGPGTRLASPTLA